MTTATPGRCASGNRRNSRCVTDVSHCKTSKLKLDDNSSSPIKTIQLDQESSDHQYEQSLNSPLLKSKGVIAVTAIMETLTGGDLPGRPNKASSINPNTRSQKLVAKGPRPSQYECYSKWLGWRPIVPKDRNTQMLSLLD